jgi:hypothetical protein
MAIELHHLNTHGMMEQACDVLDGVAKLKARIAELEEERRWRKFSEEKPKEDTKFIVVNEKGFIQCCYYSPILKEFQIPVTYWMPLPSAPKEEK